MSDLSKLREIVKKLRAPDGCDWDKQQTHKSLTPYLIEETYEVVEAIELNNYDALKEELGDLLLHIVFQVDLAEDNKKFKFNEVINDICEKLVKRHPHIFDNKGNKSLEKENWEKTKQKEKDRASILDGVPKSMPALLRARRIQEKASTVGFDWEKIEPVVDKIKEEVEELEDAMKSNTNIDEELGDVLFSIVNLSRHLKINPETSLQNSINKFYSRFVNLERNVKKENLNMKNMTLNELDVLWEKIKKE